MDNLVLRDLTTVSKFVSMFHGEMDNVISFREIIYVYDYTQKLLKKTEDPERVKFIKNQYERFVGFILCPFKESLRYQRLLKIEQDKEKMFLCNQYPGTIDNFLGVDTAMNTMRTINNTLQTMITDMGEQLEVLIYHKVGDYFRNLRTDNSYIDKEQLNKLISNGRVKPASFDNPHFHECHDSKIKKVYEEYKDKKFQPELFQKIFLALFD